MKQFSQQFHKKAVESVKMDAEEKRELRERLFAYMEYHPLTERKVSEEIIAEPFTTFSIPFAGLLRSSFVAVVILVLVVPMVAERSVPGDTLYAVKVRFNEELRSTLTFDGYQKVEWETERLNRRIAEARLLASEGRLTEEVEAEVAEAVRIHTENAKREIEELRSEDADGAEIAAITLDTTLEVQAVALRSELKNTEESGEEIEESVIADTIDASREKVENTETTILPSYDKLMARVEQNTTRIYELRDSLITVASEEEILDINRRINDLDRMLSEAIASLENDEAGTRQMMVEIMQRSQKLIVFMTELELAKTVDIEKIVPVVLTDEEKKNEKERLMNEVSQKQEQINNLLAVAEDGELADKIEGVLVEIDEYRQEMASSSDNFVAYKIIAEEVMVLADDVLVLLNQQIELPEKIGESATTTASSTEEVVETEENLEEDFATTTEEIVLPEVSASSTEDSNPNGQVDSE